MKSKKHTYEGKSITVSYDLKRCIHAAECLAHLPQVFDARSKPWVQPDRSSSERVSKAVELCPTGALHYTRNDGGAEEQPASTNTAAIAVNGPIYLKGKLKLVNSETGESLDETRVALCRCGATKNKPFCDNSHGPARFMATAEIMEDKMQLDDDTDTGDGTLTAAFKSSGSYAFRGPMRITDRAGNILSEGNCAWLCSCGLSANKPFCDGSHKGL